LIESARQTRQNRLFGRLRRRRKLESDEAIFDDDDEVRERAAGVYPDTQMCISSRRRFCHRNNETKFRFRRLGRLDLRDALGAKVELTGEFSTSASRRIVKTWPDCELRPEYLPNYQVIRVRLEAPSSTSLIGALPENLFPLVILIPASRLASEIHIAM